MQKNKIKITLLAIFIFLLFSSFSYSNICCMFSASRYYGWPFSYLSLHKAVETYEEASRIKTDRFWELKKDGWEFSFSVEAVPSKPYQSIALGSPAIGLILDLGLSFALAWGIFEGIKKIK